MTHNELPLFYVFHFYFFGIVGIASALAFVTRKSPVAAALWLVNTMFCLAALYVLLDAQFIGAMQVLVYAGAIMVVFLFVIMLLNLGHASELADARGMWWKLAAGLVGLALLAQVFALTRAHVPEALTLPENALAAQFARTGAIAPLAGPLFNEYLLAFEVTSVLLLAAVVGAVVLGKRKERPSAY
jgi:NADH-quinone oxidoreductase subunit J